MKDVWSAFYTGPRPCQQERWVSHCTPGPRADRRVRTSLHACPGKRWVCRHPASSSMLFVASQGHKPCHGVRSFYLLGYFIHFPDNHTARAEDAIRRWQAWLSLQCRTLHSPKGALLHISHPVRCKEEYLRPQTKAGLLP